MSSSFDVEKIMKHVSETAADHLYKVLEDARWELGPDGHAIKINKSALRRSGDKLDLGNVAFPSEDVKQRFLKIVQRKMR
jgi:hypothetical protein